MAQESALNLTNGSGSGGGGGENGGNISANGEGGGSGNGGGGGGGGQSGQNGGGQSGGSRSSTVAVKSHTIDAILGLSRRSQDSAVDPLGNLVMTNRLQGFIRQDLVQSNGQQQQHQRQQRVAFQIKEEDEKRTSSLSHLLSILHH